MRDVLVWLGIAAAAVLYYASSCLFWPYAWCLRCKGKGRFPAWWGGGFRHCGWCGGSGKRLRVGRWVWNRYAKLRGNARKGQR